ncbi:MAG: tyrosine--tRNA ligase [Pseudomonadales bacterium]|nr:tyrosine--tRNA ligase [Pseudomonadales bacterium]MDP6970046.1 tyrosine--tRNA ligase [Pseudomonadales bacterium]
MSLIDDLRQRGLVAQASDESGLARHLAEGSRRVYCGFDPTADSLHIGNLVPLLTLRRFQLFGHAPILLLGGATGMIGDPSGRSDERNLNDQAVVDGWMERIRSQVEHFVDFEGNSAATMVNNLQWTRNLDVMTFLRNVGKHFSVNAMIQRESVKNRLDREGAGISFTEFSYMLLQSNDFVELFQRHDCTVQIGGNDQWGNIVSGVDLIRRRLGGEAYALTLPLVTKADGTKFGKTAAGAVWLDPARKSPYGFFQFWMNTADADVVHYLKTFTFLSFEEIEALGGEVSEHPERREAQKRLATEVTRLVHGADALASAERISASLFGGDLAVLEKSDLEQLRLDGMDATDPGGSSFGLLAVMVDCGLAKSRGAARKLVSGGGVRINGVPVSDPGIELDWSDALFGCYYLIRRGKKNWHMLVRETG